MEKIEKLLEEIDSLTVIELSELVKGIEEKYGVSAAAVAAPVAGGAAAGAAEEKSEFQKLLKNQLLKKKQKKSKLNLLKLEQLLNYNN